MVNLRKKIILSLLVVILTFSSTVFWVGVVKAESSASAIDFANAKKRYSAAQAAKRKARADLKECEMRLNLLLIEIKAYSKPLPSMDEDDAGDISNIEQQIEGEIAITQEECGNLQAEYVASKNAETTAKSDYIKARNSALLKRLKSASSVAVKTAWVNISRKFAFNTAKWLATGGKGQQPLYRTEGVKTYMKDAVDQSLGIFLDEFMTGFLGIDICKPSFNVRLGIVLGLNFLEPEKADCSWKKIKENWQEAWKDRDFDFKYRTAMKSGENDITTYLKVQNQLYATIMEDQSAKEMEYQIGKGWEDMEDFSGKILTPSTIIGHQPKSVQDVVQDSSVGWGTWFGGTFADVAAIFVNTLSAKFFDNLVNGYFSGGSRSGKSYGINTGSSGGRRDSGGIYSSESSPKFEGIEGAKDRFANLLEAKVAVGSSYDVLNKLTQCDDTIRNNPGPTDCVIDENFAQEVKNNHLVINLSDNIKNRQFTPQLAQAIDPSTAFTLRSIIILRKYRIVPVGWEIAARYIDKYGDQTYTLGGLIDSFADGDPYPWAQYLVDPYWVLKAPKLFCRRQGYGPDLDNSPDDSISRIEYCADEQQCIAEDDEGNCSAFGYCTEEKRIWRFQGKKCQPRYNTCQTFSDAKGKSVSYLANTLDYRNCSMNNAGCQWYSQEFSPEDNWWLHDTVDKTLKQCDAPAGCLVDTADMNIPNERLIEKWHQISANGRIMIEQPCQEDGGCDIDNVSCTIPKGRARCMVNSCVANYNILEAINGDFSDCDSINTYDATNWKEGYANSNNRHSCVIGGRDNNALEVYSLNASQEITSTLDVNLNSTSENFSLRFFAKGGVANGRILVQVFTGNVQLPVTGGFDGEFNSGNIDNFWQDYIIQFNNSIGADVATIKITTTAGTTGTVYFDNFDLREVVDNCSNEPVWLSLGTEFVDNKEIYFDRDVTQCSSDASGCHQFIRTKAGLSSNLILNSDFELDDNRDGIPDGWSSSGLAYEQNKIKNGNISAGSPEIISRRVSLFSNSYYALSASASQVSGSVNNESLAGITVRLCDASGDCSSTGRAAPIANIGNCRQQDNMVSLEFTPDGTDLERWSCWFKVNEYATGGEILLAVESVDGEIWFDNIKLEQVDHTGYHSLTYTPYNPAERPDRQLAYLKKAPDYYQCYLTSAGVWPENTNELTAVLENKTDYCNNYAGVCIADEVNCELYEPINGDPAVPAIVSSGDLCPSECVGYQVYKQEQTDFVNELFTQFIANDTPVYCSAAHAGCDEFTNLDEVAKGGEGLDYYVQLRACQKPGNGTDATYYTWEGSDTTGYQLKSYDLKHSAAYNGLNIIPSINSNAPCVNLAYYQAGGRRGENYCQDPYSGTDLPALISGAINDSANMLVNEGLAVDLSGYLEYLRIKKDIIDRSILNQSVVDELHQYGICAKQELHGYYISGYQDVYNSAIAHYPFDGNVDNINGIGLDGAMVITNKPTATTDSHKGGAYEFNGNDFIDLGPNNELARNISEITISAWVKLNVSLGSERADYEIISNENYQQFGYNFEIKNNDAPVSDAGKILFRTNQNGQSAFIQTEVQTYPNDGEWHHLVAVKDGNVGRIYLDGEEVSLSSSQSLVDPTNSLISTHIGGVDQLFKGKIDEVAIWKQALSEAEIKSLYLESDYINIVPNPDCREFFSVGGQISYRLLSRTVTVTDNCFPYRRTQTQSDQVSVQCPALDAYATVSATQCDCVSNEGYWNEHDECIYMAVPKEGVSCPANMSGCREYTGNQGNNIRYISFDDFEYDMGDWTGGILSSEAVNPGGTSAKTNGILEKPVNIKTNKAYILSFWAKGQNTFTLQSIKFSNTNNPNDYFAENDDDNDKVPRLEVTPTWQRYELGPVFVTWESGENETIKFNTGGGRLFVDNILLKEVRNNIYLLENTWFTPYSCDNTLLDSTGEKTGCGDGASYLNRCVVGEMLGCQSYNDREFRTFNLKSFESLCRPEAVGCEALIDTYNSNSPFEEEFNEDIPPPDDNTDDITVLEDKLVYLVNNNNYTCVAEDKGCTAYGMPTINNRNEVIGYERVYLKNQPDRYITDLCKFDELRCAEYIGSRSNVYFKDPRDKLCEYRTVATTTAWYMKNSDEECDTSAYQTIGQGVKEEKIQPIGWIYAQAGSEHPDYDGWAGVCPANQNSCTEYIDPLSKIYTNLVFNGDFEKDLDKDGEPDGWDCGNSGCPVQGSVRQATQNVALTGHTLYTFSMKAKGDVDSVIKCHSGNSLWSPDASLENSLTNAVQMIKSNLNENTYISGRFYVTNTDICVLNLFTNGASAEIDDVKIVPSGVYYYLDNTVDRSGCNGLIDLKTGCVLFNDRGEINYGEKNYSNRVRDNYLVFDVDKTSQKAEDIDSNNSGVSSQISPVNGEMAQKNSNVILKVRPDRQCASWLYCTTYEAGDVNNPSQVFRANDRCLDLGLCAALDDKGECVNLITFNQLEVNASVLPPAPDYEIRNVNSTGYAMLGKKWNGGAIAGGEEVISYYPYHIMTQKGESATVPNGDFETLAGDSSEPLVWTVADDLDRNGWQDYKFSIDTDAANRRDSVGYLKVNSAHEVMSEFTDVRGGEEYYITAWVNTLDLHTSNSKALILIKQFHTNGDVNEDAINDCEANNDCVVVNVGYNDDTKEGKEKWELWTNLAMNYNLPWTHLGQKIIVHANTGRIRIRLINHPGPYLNSSNDSNENGLNDTYEDCHDEYDNTICNLLGHSLFDSIQLKPVLQVNQDEAQAISRTCRLYPAENSWACKYYQGNNLYYGWYGYCLVRDPQNPSVCLQWWPLDQIKGEVLDEISGYSDRIPLYYCLMADVEVNDNWVNVGNNSSKPEGSIMYGGRINLSSPIINLPGNDIKLKIVDEADNKTNTFKITLYNHQGVGVTSGEINARVDVGGGTTQINISNHFANIKDLIYGISIKCFAGDHPSDSSATNRYCHLSYVKVKHMIDSIGCKYITKVVTEIGNNKAWYGRTIKGSFYELNLAGNSFSAYQTDHRPFGSMITGEPINDPRFWYEQKSEGSPIYPLTVFSTSSKKFNKDIGLPYAITGGIEAVFGRCSISNQICLLGDTAICEVNETCDQVAWPANVSESISLIKNIFARNYGIWKWIDGVGYDYATSTGISWDVPTTECAFYPRNPESNDYCFIKPRVNNIKVNDNDLVMINDGSGVVKLSFNAVVDPDQLPMTGYVVKWGDGVNNSVSGVNLRNRINFENPLELYHFYDYWQMKSRANSDLNPVDNLDCEGSYNSPAIDIDGDGNIDTVIPDHYCITKITVGISDNWNKDSDNTALNGWVVVRE